jgi:hypothetical protein
VAMARAESGGGGRGSRVLGAETDGDGRGGRAEARDRPVGRAYRSMGGWKPRAAGNACATLAGTTRELSVM